MMTQPRTAERCRTWALSHQQHQAGWEQQQELTAAVAWCMGKPGSVGAAAWMMALTTEA